MMVTEYRDRFLQLTRYAPAEVADDREKQEHFMEGLEDYLQYALSTSTSTTSTIWLTAHSTRSASTWRWRTRRGRLSPLLPAATLALDSSSPSSTSSSTGLPSRTSRGRSSTRLDSSRQVRARGYRHLRLVLLHQLRQHLRLHVRQLLSDSRLRHLHASAITVASRGTTPTIAPGRRRRDSRGAQLSPGRQHRVG